MQDQPKNGASKYVTVSLLWFAQFFSYMIRFALGIVAPTLMKLYHFSPKTMGYILAGWNWSYTGALLIIGPVIDHLGPWIVMGLGSVIWGLSTMALPMASTFASFIALRFLFGLGHSPLIPVNAAGVSRTFDAKERARAVAVSFSGNQVGLAVGATVAGFLLFKFGWHGVFYGIGGASMLFSVAWFLFYPDKHIGKGAKPAPGPRTGAAGSSSIERISWFSLFGYRATWGIAFGQMGYLYAQFFFVSWLPGYLILERHMTLLKSGFAAALPFWVGMVATLGGGWLGDYLIKHGVSPTTSRKSIIGVGLTLSTITVIAAAYVTQSWAAVTLLTLSVGSLRLTTGSANSLPIDLAPLPLVGSLTSIQNFFGNVGGLLAPIVTGLIVSATGSFVLSLVAAGGMALFGAISYVFIMGNLETGRIGSRTPAGISPTRAV